MPASLRFRLSLMAVWVWPQRASQFHRLEATLFGRWLVQINLSRLHTTLWPSGRSRIVDGVIVPENVVVRHADAGDIGPSHGVCRHVARGSRRQLG